MKKLFFVALTTIFMSACSVVPYHKSGTITTDKTVYNLKGGHLVIDMYEIHILDETGNITIYKKEIREMNLKY